MRFDTSQQMKLGQQMKLAPRMIQSMEILQMPLVELEERIEQELESNPTLEIAEVEYDPDAEKVERDDLRADDEFDRLDAFEAQNPDAADNEYSASGLRKNEFEPGQRASSRLDGERDGKLDAMAAVPARSGSVEDQLLAQWGLVDVRERLRPLGEIIIGHLDEDGYLRTPIEDVADKAPRSVVDAVGGVELEDWKLAHQAVQLLLEPAGIGARDARECLLLQLDAIAEGATERSVDPESLAIARRLASDWLDELMNNRLPKIAEKTGLDLDEIKLGIDVLRRLSLSPARSLRVEAPSAITPDAIVEYDEENDRYIAYLNDRVLPNVQINREYALMSKDRQMPKADRDFLKKNLGNAQWLLDAVEQRRGTLLRVINVVLEEQREFFDFGPESLKPLPMSQVADRLGVHVATVSRAVSEKYLDTPRGIVGLRGFFTGGMTTDDGEDVSYDAIKATLKEVVEGEDPAKPFSDEALVKQLKERGIEIARRTVAKYRGQMNIPTARLRKKF